MPVTMRPTLVLDYTMTAVGVTENVDHTATRPFAIIRNWNVCLAADAASTTQIQRQALGGGFNAVSNALACAVASTLTDDTGANALVVAQYVVAATDVVRCVFTSANSTLNARHFCQILPTVITGA